MAKKLLVSLFFITLLFTLSWSLVEAQVCVPYQSCTWVQYNPPAFTPGAYSCTNEISCGDMATYLAIGSETPWQGDPGTKSITITEGDPLPLVWNNPAIISPPMTGSCTASSSFAPGSPAAIAWSGVKNLSGNEVITSDVTVGGVTSFGTYTVTLSCTRNAYSDIPASSDSDSVQVTLVSGPMTRNLSVGVLSGSGNITGTGINCPGDCLEAYPENNIVNVIATPSSGYKFSSWSGACAGQGPSCWLTMDASKSTSITFVEDEPDFNYSLSDTAPVNINKSSSLIGQKIINLILLP